MQLAAPGPQSGPLAATAAAPATGASQVTVMQPAAPGPSTSTRIADMLEAAGTWAASGSTGLLTPQTVLGLKAWNDLEREHQQVGVDMQHLQALRESNRARQPTVMTLCDMQRINAMMENILARQCAVSRLHGRLHAAIRVPVQQGHAGAAPTATHPGGMGGRGLGARLGADELAVVSEREFVTLVDMLMMARPSARDSV